VTLHSLAPSQPPARQADSTSSADRHLAPSVQDIPIHNSLKPAPHLVDADGGGGREDADHRLLASLHAICSQPAKIY